MSEVPLYAGVGTPTVNGSNAMPMAPTSRESSVSLGRRGGGEGEGALRTQQTLEPLAWHSKHPNRATHCPLYTSLCSGELNAIRKHKCFI